MQGVSIQNSEQATVTGAGQSTTRLYFLDNLRVALIMLVILHHLAITYGAVGLWYYTEPPDDELVSLVFGVFVLLNQGFFMGLFFLISSYFIPASYERKGARRFLRDRVARLGIPIVVFVFVLGPLAMLPVFEYVNATAAPGETLPYWQFYLVSISFGPGPLWFLELLLFFSLLYVGWRWLRRGREKAQAEMMPVNAARPGSPPSGLAIILFTLLLALVTFAWRIWVPIGLNIPVVAMPTPSHFPQYIALFIVGILAYRHKWLMTITDSVGRVALIVTALATLPMLAAAAVNLESYFATFVGGMNTIAFIYALWEAIFCVGMAIGLLTTFHQHFNHSSALAKSLATHAYTVYIIHAPVIVALAYTLSGWPLAPFLKFVVASLIAIPLCFAVAWLVRKAPYAERVL